MTSVEADRPDTPRAGASRPSGVAVVGDVARVDPGRWLRADTVAVAAAVVIITVSGVVGAVLNARGVNTQLEVPPIVARFDPHVGWGTPLAVGCVVLALALQRVAGRLPWRRLLVAGWAIGLAWICSLALIDGLEAGWAVVLTSQHEYLAEIGRVGDPLSFLAGFSDRIVDGPGSWTTHVSAHPPLITLVFWALDRIGLGGGFWAGTLCILVSSLVVPAIPTVLRSLAGPGGRTDAAARRLVPLLAVFPGAIWMGVSADGLFAGVMAVGLAVTTAAVVRRRLVWSAVGGLLLGIGVFLSYGSILIGVVAATVLVITVLRHGIGVLVAWAVALGAAVAVALIHLALGFNWFTALGLLRIRYYQGVASQRPYGYFLFANLGAWLLACSPLLAVVVRRAVVALRRRSATIIAAVCLAGVAAALIADVSGMTKAETERIWLSYGVVAYAGGGLLTGRAARIGLVLAAGTALVINHVLRTGW